MTFFCEEVLSCHCLKVLYEEVKSCLIGPSTNLYYCYGMMELEKVDSVTHITF